MGKLTKKELECLEGFKYLYLDSSDIESIAWGLIPDDAVFSIKKIYSEYHSGYQSSDIYCWENIPVVSHQSGTTDWSAWQLSKNIFQVLAKLQELEVINYIYENGIIKIFVMPENENDLSWIYTGHKSFVILYDEERVIASIAQKLKSLYKRRDTLLEIAEKLYLT